MQSPYTSPRRIAGTAAPIILFLLSALLHPPQADCKELTTRYSDIYYNDDNDLVTFSRNIGNWSFLDFFGKAAVKNPLIAARRVDELTVDVMKALDLHVPGLHFSITLHETEGDMEQSYRLLVSEGAVPAAYYDQAAGSIHVFISTVSKGMLAHEIAHAVICKCFNPPPPAALQEILAQYVDRKLGQDQ